MDGFQGKLELSHYFGRVLKEWKSSNLRQKVFYRGWFGLGFTLQERLEPSDD